MFCNNIGVLEIRRASILALDLEATARQLRRHYEDRLYSLAMILSNRSAGKCESRGPDIALHQSLRTVTGTVLRTIYACC